MVHLRAMYDLLNLNALLQFSQLNFSTSFTFLFGLWVHQHNDPRFNSGINFQISMWWSGCCWRFGLIIANSLSVWSGVWFQRALLHTHGMRLFTKVEFQGLWMFYDVEMFSCNIGIFICINFLTFKCFWTILTSDFAL